MMGLLFHPEIDADIMLAYIQQHADALTAVGRDVTSLMDEFTDTLTNNVKYWRNLD